MDYVFILDLVYLQNFTKILKNYSYITLIYRVIGLGWGLRLGPEIGPRMRGDLVIDERCQWTVEIISSHDEGVKVIGWAGGYDLGQKLVQG